MFEKRIVLLLAAQVAAWSTCTSAFSVAPSFGGIGASAAHKICAPLRSEVNDVSAAEKEEAVEEDTPTSDADEESVEETDESEPSTTEETPPPVASESTESAPEQVQGERFSMFLGNLPFGVADEEIRDMFSQYGTVETISIPRSRETGQTRGFAFVDMSSKEEVVAAVEALNGAMLGGRTIRVAESLPKEQVQKAGPIVDEGVKKIYIGNIPFGVDKTELIQFYEEYGPVKDLYIPLEAGTGRQRGFAFITMAEEDAEKAIEATNGAMFMGRKLAVSFPLPRGEKAPAREGPPRTKLYVGNLSFYTSIDAVQSMFEEYGTILDCYMPEDRETGGSRGFAFVTMAAEDAERAIDGTDGYELDGRILRVNEAQPKGARGQVAVEKEFSDEGFGDEE